MFNKISNPLQLLIFILGLITYIGPNLAQCATKSPTLYDDWVCSAAHPLCGGFYQEAPLPFPLQCETVLKGQDMTITSDRGEFMNEGPTRLLGNVHLIQGNRQVFGDRATIYRNSETRKIKFIEAEGNVKILEPGLRLEGCRGTLDIENNTKNIYDSNFRLYARHARGKARHIFVRNNDFMTLEDATYTTCSPYSNTWELKAKKVKLDKKSGRGKAYHSRLYLKDIPVFYFPYVDFPIDHRRKTGFLTPSFGTTSSSGTEIALPFYWNIAPNYDATITPRYFSKRGGQVQAEFRSMTENSCSELKAAILPDDRAYKKFKIEKINQHPGIANNDPRVTGLSKSGNSRQQFFGHHRTDFNQNWSTRLHYHTVGDDNYFADLSESFTDRSTVQLLQQGDVVFQDENWNGLFRVQNHQTLHPFKGPIATGTYQRLPQIALQNYYSDLPCGLVWTLPTELTKFSHQRDPFTGRAFTTGNRIQARPGLSLPLIYSAGYIKPRVQWNYLSYSLDLNQASIQNRQPKYPHRSIPMFDLDSGLIFEKNVCVFNENYIQTFEPRLYYLYVPFRDQNNLPIFDTAQGLFDYNLLYRENRFNGLDRVGDANQLTLGASSRFLKTNTGQERLYLSVGQIYYFKSPQVTTCNSTLNPACINKEMPLRNQHTSAIAGMAAYRLQDDVTGYGSLEWNPNTTQTDKMGVNVQYQPDELNVLNLGYEFLRRNPAAINPNNPLSPITLRSNNFNPNVPERLEQADGSFAYALNDYWRLLGHWRYDIRLQHTLEILGGIEVQGCCTALRFSLLKYRLPPSTVDPKKYNSVFYVQFVFKGFAGVGNSPLKVQTRSIPGYTWRGNDY